MLRTAHTPNKCARPIISHQFRNTLKLRPRNASDTLCFSRSPLLDLSQYIFHAIYALANKFFIFPLVLKNVPHDAPNQSDIRSRTKAYILICVRSGTCKPRVTNDNRSIVLLFGFHQMHKRNRVSFSWVSTNDKNCFGIMNVIVGVCHRTVAPGVCNTSYCC